RALKRLRAVLELFQVGVAGKTAGWHRGLLSPEPRVRNQGWKGEPTTNTFILLQVGFAIYADRQDHAWHAIENPRPKGSVSSRQRTAATLRRQSARSRPTDEGGCN